MDADDGKYLAETLRLLEHVDAWTARINDDASGLQPAPHSPLRGDDDKAHPYQLSNAAWLLLGSAADHLGGLRALLGDAKVIPRSAAYTLVRAGLENACGAVWLLKPAKRAERLTRRLLLAREDVRQREQARRLISQPGPRTEQECLDEIRDIAKRGGLDDVALKGKATYTEIVQTVDQSEPGRDIQMMWKVCSAFSHGDMWATLGWSQRIQMPNPAQPGIAAFRVEADLRLLTLATATAVGVTESGWRLYDERSQSPY
jgi:hypothetical protein